MDTHHFVGAWRLVSTEFKDADGKLTYPYGPDPQGILTYTADGYMSGAIMDSQRQPFASGNIFDATDAERAAVAYGYVSYAGRFEVVEGKVLHHVEVSLAPNWLGTTQERGYRLDGDRLTLVAPRGTLVWERVARTS